MCDIDGIVVQGFSESDSGSDAAGSTAGLSGTTREIFPRVYSQLRELAHAKMGREKPGLTLQTTALVHEVFIRLSHSPDVKWENPRHFFAAAAEAMRRILVERARRYATEKRGGKRRREDLSFVDAVADNADAEALLSLDEAIEELRGFDPDLAEVVMLRYFAGLSVEEVGNMLDRSPRSIKYDWSAARAWLLRRLSDGKPT